MKTVDVDAVFIREEAKQAGDTHRYIVSSGTSTLLTSSHIAQTTMSRKKLFAHVITT